MPRNRKLIRSAFYLQDSGSQTPFLLLSSNRKLFRQCIQCERRFVLSLDIPSHITWTAFCLLRVQKFWFGSAVWEWFSVFFPSLYNILINIFFMGRSCRWRYAIRMSRMKDALWLVDGFGAVCARKMPRKTSISIKLCVFMVLMMKIVSDLFEMQFFIDKNAINAATENFDMSISHNGGERCRPIRAKLS